MSHSSGGEKKGAAVLITQTDQSGMSAVYLP